MRVGEGGHRRRAVLRPVDRRADAGGLAAEIRVEEAEAADQPRIDRAFGDLLGRAEIAVVGVDARAQDAIADRPGPFGEDVERLEVARDVIGAVVVAELTADEEIADS